MTQFGAKIDNYQFDKNQTYMLFDNTFIKKAATPIKDYIINTESLNLIVSFEIENNSNTFLYYLDKILEKLDFEALVTEEVCLESIGMNWNQDSFFLKNFISERTDNYDTKKAFFKDITIGSMQRVSPYPAILPETEEILSIIDNMRMDRFSIDSSQKCQNLIKGKQLGDKSIKSLIDKNPDIKFFVITSDNKLGAEVNLRPNSNSMNFSGLWASLAESGVLTEIGFTEDENKHLLPTGNEVVDGLFKLGNAANRFVTNSPEFELHLSERGLFFPKKRTEFTSFEEVLLNRESGNKIIEMITAEYANSSSIIQQQG